MVWTIQIHYIPNHLSVTVIPNLCGYNLRVINQQRFPNSMSPSWPSFFTPQRSCTKQLVSAVKRPLRSCNIFILEFPKRYQKHSKAPNRLRKCKCYLWTRRLAQIYTNLTKLVWLVVYLPLWKIWLRQLGWWHSQYMESHSKFHGSSHHQPVIINH